MSDSVTSASSHIQYTQCVCLVKACLQERGLVLRKASHQITCHMYQFKTLIRLFHCIVLKHIYAHFPQSLHGVSTHTHAHTCTSFDVNHSGGGNLESLPWSSNCTPICAPLYLRDDRTKCDGTSLEIALDIKAKPLPLDYDFSKKKWLVSGEVLQRTPQISTLQ